MTLFSNSFTQDDFKRLLTLFAYVNSTIEKSDIKPDYIFDSVKDIIDLL